jgi:hypothetical protein
MLATKPYAVRRSAVTLPFDTGRVMLHPQIRRRVARCGLTLKSYLGLHRRGRWGDVDSSLARLNRFAARTGIGFIVSRHTGGDGELLEILTVLSPESEPITIVRPGLPEGDLERNLSLYEPMRAAPAGERL